jgi:Sulfotransferase domain
MVLTMTRSSFIGALLVVVCATIFSVGKLVGDSVFGFSEGGLLVTVSLKSEQLMSNATTTHESASILELSWEEKMRGFFSNKECIGASSDSTYKPTPQQSWLGKVTVLVGVMKGGTKAINTYLSEHPHFISQCDESHQSKELHFFNQFNSKTQTINATDLQIRYGRLIETKCPLAMKSLLTDQSKLMFLDDTPVYMQDSDSIPPLLNCVLPQAKIISVLRNPTDRAFSHYNFYKHCATKSFDEWVDIEIRRLTDAGIVGAKDPYEELLAWQRYNSDPAHRHQRQCETFVARGLYAIQGLHYITALQASGRPLSDMHFVHSEDLEGEKRQHEYDKMLNFLGLSNHTLRPRGKTHVTVYTRTMNESTRVKLNEFYRPYNLRLYDLLDWQPVWE